MGVEFWLGFMAGVVFAMMLRRRPEPRKPTHVVFRGEDE